MRKRSYAMLVIDLLIFSASPIALPPSAPRLFSLSLQKGGHNGGFEVSSKFRAKSHYSPL